MPRKKLNSLIENLKSVDEDPVPIKKRKLQCESTVSTSNTIKVPVPDTGSLFVTPQKPQIYKTTQSPNVLQEPNAEKNSSSIGGVLQLLNCSVLTNPENHSQSQIDAARKRIIRLGVDALMSCSEGPRPTETGIQELARTLAQKFRVLRDEPSKSLIMHDDPMKPGKENYKSVTSQVRRRIYNTSPAVTNRGKKRGMKLNDGLQLPVMARLEDSNSNTTDEVMTAEGEGSDMSDGEVDLDDSVTNSSTVGTENSSGKSRSSNIVKVNRSGKSGASNEENRSDKTGLSNEENGSGKSGSCNVVRENRSGKSGASNEENRSEKTGLCNVVRENRSRKSGASNEENRSGKSGSSNEKNRSEKTGSSNVVREDRSRKSGSSNVVYKSSSSRNDSDSSTKAGSDEEGVEDRGQESLIKELKKCTENTSTQKVKQLLKLTVAKRQECIDKLPLKGRMKAVLELYPTLKKPENLIENMLLLLEKTTTTKLIDKIAEKADTILDFLSSKGMLGIPLSKLKSDAYRVMTAYAYLPLVFNKDISKETILPKHLLVHIVKIDQPWQDAAGSHAKFAHPWILTYRTTEKKTAIVIMNGDAVVCKCLDISTALFALMALYYTGLVPYPACQQWSLLYMQKYVLGDTLHKKDNQLLGKYESEILKFEKDNKDCFD